MICDICEVVQIQNTGLFKMLVAVLTTCHLVLHVICFYGGYVKDQVYVPPLSASIPELRYESEPPLKLSQLTCYKQFGTSSIIVLMFVESQRVHI